MLIEFGVSIPKNNRPWAANMNWDMVSGHCCKVALSRVFLLDITKDCLYTPIESMRLYFRGFHSDLKSFILATCKGINSSSSFIALHVQRNDSAQKMAQCALLMSC